MSFLSSLKSLLASEEREHDALNDNPNFIVRPSRIKHMLQSLMESHVQISIVLDDQSEHTSRILDVSENDIVLDQFNSREAHNKMVKGTMVQIDAKHHSVPFNFSASLIGTSRDGGYIISTPEKIYHPQKRSFFRVPLVNIEKYKFTGAIQYSENLVSGYIYDVSFGVILPFAMYLTPVIYPTPTSGTIATLMKLNPLAILIETTRNWFSGQHTGIPLEFAFLGGVTIVLLIVGIHIYRVSMPIIIERFGG